MYYVYSPVCAMLVAVYKYTALTPHILHTLPSSSLHTHHPHIHTHHPHTPHTPTTLTYLPPPHKHHTHTPQYPYESLFRSTLFALMDNCCREYLFVVDFFGLTPNTAQTFFDAIMGKTLAYLLVSENLVNVERSFPPKLLVY